MPKVVLIFLALQFTLALSGTAQESPYYAGCGKYPGLIMGYSGDSWQDPDPDLAHFRASDLLQIKYGVKLNNENLRAALSGDNVQARYLAAWVLADQGARDAMPEIFQAFETEGCAAAPRLCDLACALAELGDRRGAEALHEFCEDQFAPRGP